MKYDIKGRPIGCGYCLYEKASLGTCKIHDPKINKAKLGCKDYKHYKDETKS